MPTLTPALCPLYGAQLAQWIRQTQTFEGICFSRNIHKVALYVDDVLVYSSNPSSSLPLRLSLLEISGKHSRYKLNRFKYQPLETT